MIDTVLVASLRVEHTCVFELRQNKYVLVHGNEHTGRGMELLSASLFGTVEFDLLKRHHVFFSEFLYNKLLEF